MSEVLNLKYMLPERLHGRYISNDQIKRDPRPRDADIDTLAHVLVSERHGKFDLVRLVAYLLRECASTQAAELAECRSAVAEVLALLERSLAVIQHDIDEIGGCDHSVGICCCELIRLADDIRAAMQRTTAREGKSAPRWLPGNAPPCRAS